MIFNFAIDEVKPCLVRRNFIIEADTLEQAQAEAVDQLSRPETTKLIDQVEVYLETEGKPNGYRRLVYRAENGGQVLKATDKPNSVPRYIISDTGQIFWPKDGVYGVYGTEEGPGKTSTLGWTLEGAVRAGFKLVF